jgi:hypothetical protein
MFKHKIAPYTVQEHNAINLARELLQSCLKDEVSFETFELLQKNYNFVAGAASHARHQRTELLNRKFWNRKK